jgi:predicted DNA-binding protein
MESQMQAIGFRMATEEKERLEKVAQEQGRSLSGQIRFILNAYLKGQAIQSPDHQKRNSRPA